MKRRRPAQSTISTILVLIFSLRICHNATEARKIIRDLRPQLHLSLHKLRCTSPVWQVALLRLVVVSLCSSITISLSKTAEAFAEIVNLRDPIMTDWVLELQVKLNRCSAWHKAGTMWHFPQPSAEASCLKDMVTCGKRSIGPCSTFAMSG